MASADFRNAEEALGELSEMEDSIDMRFHRADAGAADFQVGQTPINALRSGAQERATKTQTDEARKRLHAIEHALKEWSDDAYLEVPAVISMVSTLL